MNFSPSRMISFNSDRFIQHSPGVRPAHSGWHHIMEVPALEQAKLSLSGPRPALEVEGQELAETAVADRGARGPLVDVDIRAAIALDDAGTVLENGDVPADADVVGGNPGGPLGRVQPLYR